MRYISLQEQGSNDLKYAKIIMQNDGPFYFQHMENHVVLLGATVNFPFAPNSEQCYCSIYLLFCTILIEMNIFFYVQPGVDKL